jgi:hypothetical protein
MTKPMIEIHNITTNEVVNREMTDAEYEQYQLDLAKTTAKHAEAIAIEEGKIAAQAKLAALGLTAEDLKALGL